MAQQEPERKITYPGLQLEEDMVFKRRDWVFERAGWIAMALIIGLALAGMFSRGMLSQRTVTDPTGALAIHYERFQRFQSPTTMVIEIVQPPEGDMLRLHIGGDLVRHFEFGTIRPQPQSTAITGEGWIYEFPTPVSSGVIQISVQPQTLASATALIGLAGAPPAELPVFIYP